MTVHDDLATLRGYLGVGVALDADHQLSVRAKAVPALARVEAEIARLGFAKAALADIANGRWNSAPSVPGWNGTKGNRANEYARYALRALLADQDGAEAALADMRRALEGARWAINLGVGCARDLGDAERLDALIKAERAARAAAGPAPEETA